MQGQQQTPEQQVNAHIQERATVAAQAEMDRQRNDMSNRLAAQAGQLAAQQELIAMSNNQIKSQKLKIAELEAKVKELEAQVGDKAAKKDAGKEGKAA